MNGQERGEVHWSTLYEIAKALGSALNLPAVLNLIAKNAAEAMKVKASSLRLLDDRGEKLELVAAYGLSDEYLRKGPVEVEKSLIDREALEGRPVAVLDVTKDHRWQYPEEAKREGIYSVLCAPLSVRDKVIGSLRVYTSTPHEFEEEEIRFLSALAGLGAIAIENARLHQSLQRRYENMSTLFEVAKATASSLTLQDVLNSIAKNAAEAMKVKASSLRLLDDRGEKLELVAAYGLSDEYLRKGPVEVEKSLIDREALEGRPVAVLDVTKDHRWQYPEEAKREGIYSVLCAPLSVRDKVIGSLRVYTSTPHEFEEEEIRFLSALAGHAALAIEKARLYEQMLAKQRLEYELHIAHHIQMNLLPQECPQMGNFDFAVVSVPAGEVGGDYYDFIPIDKEHVGIAVGHISGQEMASALLMAIVSATLRVQAENVRDLRSVMARVNSSLYNDMFMRQKVTIFYGVLDATKGTFRYVNAGHRYALLFPGSTKWPEPLKSTGPSMGREEKVLYAQKKVSFKPGDILLLYTDGVIEMKDKNGRKFGTKRLYKLMAEVERLDAVSLARGIYEKVLNFIGRRLPSEDFTVIVLKRLPNGR